MSSPQHKTSSYEDIEAPKIEESKTNTNDETKFSFVQTIFNWQRNRISPTPTPTPTSQFSYYQPSSFLTHSHQFLNTTKSYKLITTEPILWERLSQSMNSIINAPTILPFQYMLNHIQNQLSSRNRDMPDISLLDDVLRSLPDGIQLRLQTLVFPEVAQLILRTPALFPNPENFLILTQGKTDTVSLTREQCACLLAHMFMCTTLRQNSSDLPMRHDFSQLYSRTQQDDKDAVKIQKILCLLNYFNKITTCSSFVLKEIVTFSRVHLDEKTHGICDLRAWTQVFDTLKEVEVDPMRKIEDVQNVVEVDFANKYLGGGVLGAGAVQEEIQFITRPEQLVGVLFCESMIDKEAIVIRGAKIYSRYKGYASTFTFDKELSFYDDEFDCEREVVAIDAKDFSNLPYYSQFSGHEILRELNKAYVGFVGDDKIPRTETGKKAVSTGNWGCGCFKGDVQLKFLIQWMAATRAGRQISYHPFGKADVSGFERIVKAYKGKCVGMLMNDILNCSSLMSTGKKSLFERLIKIAGQNKYGHL